jgi:peptide/nickel transport system ATP-binding protein
MALSEPLVAGGMPPSEPVLPSETESPSSVETPPSDESKVVLDIQDLKTYFYTYDGVVKALDGVTFQVRGGETTGLVGETGCGKSVTAFSVTRLINDPPGRVMSGKILFKDADLLWGLEREAKFIPVKQTNRVKVRRSFRRIRAANERVASVRGRGIAMIFQEPTQAMNPVFSVSNQLGEVLLLHRGVEIIDEMLAADPNAPEAGAAIDALLAAASEGNREQTVAAAAHLGEVVKLPTFGTEAYYIVREAGSSARDMRPELLRALRRRRLSGSERRYLAHRQRLLVALRQINQEHFEEMREGAYRYGPIRRLKFRDRIERWSHFYYGLWGIHRRILRPLNEELFWRVVRQLEGVSIANPPQIAKAYPHELSGGMLQRAMISMALSSEPDVLLADEPTTALDVTIQAQILELMRDLKTRVGTAILLITHDLAVIAEVADRVCVMYAGNIVEQGPVREVFRRPLHPYAQGLLASIPRLDQPEKELSSIPGSVPDLIRPPSGCRFHPRCSYAMPVCKEARPPMTLEGPEHSVACYLYKGPVVAG